MIPDLRKQISILESHIDSLKEIQKLQNINGYKEEVSIIVGVKIARIINNSFCIY